MIATWLGRFFRLCIARAFAADIAVGYDLEYSDYMTDAELSDVLNGRGHTVNWTEVQRRRAAGEVQAPWAAGNTPGAAA
jgi:hypothetical protein